MVGGTWKLTWLVGWRNIAVTRIHLVCPQVRLRRGVRSGKTEKSSSWRLRVVHIHNHVPAAIFAQGDFHFLADGQCIAHIPLHH